MKYDVHYPKIDIYDSAIGEMIVFTDGSKYIMFVKHLGYQATRRRSIDLAIGRTMDDSEMMPKWWYAI